MQVRNFLPIVLALAVWPHGSRAETLDRGIVISDPQTLRELDIRERQIDGVQVRGLGLGRMLNTARAAAAPISGRELFALPALAPVKAALDNEFERYAARSRTGAPNTAVGTEPPSAMQLFDRAALDSDTTQFLLSGVVNRMDRAYKFPGTCGEIRLIYRPVVNAARTDAAAVSPLPVSRLPMTFNLVLKARGDLPDAGNVPCAELARRWLDAGDLRETGADLAVRLISKGGALEFATPSDVDRVETNIQIGHAATGAASEDKADYLIKVFQYNAGVQTFEESPLENQIDYGRIVADARLKADFQRWLLDPAHIGELDRGTVIVPQEYLAKRAIASTPAALDGGAEAATIFRQSDVVDALAAAARDGVAFENIRSFAGFERRLSDVTCAGCHETRGIGAFHFPGIDWMAKTSPDAVTVPGSPHFIGDQPRRRDILLAVRDGSPPDYSRGFSARPQARRSAKLLGSTYLDGWGAYCALPSSVADESFADWTCAEGLSCQAIPQAAFKIVTSDRTPGRNASPRTGMCFIKSN